MKININCREGIIKIILNCRSKKQSNVDLGRSGDEEVETENLWATGLHPMPILGLMEHSFVMKMLFNFYYESIFLSPCICVFLMYADLRNEKDRLLYCLKLRNFGDLTLWELFFLCLGKWKHYLSTVQELISKCL